VGAAVADRAKTSGNGPKALLEDLSPAALSAARQAMARVKARRSAESAVFLRDMLEYKMEYDDVGGARASASSKVLQHRPHYSMCSVMDDLDVPPPSREGRFVPLHSTAITTPCSSIVSPPPSFKTAGPVQGRRGLERQKAWGRRRRHAGVGRGSPAQVPFRVAPRRSQVAAHAWQPGSGR
jgi:hypothetical protein